MKIKFKVIKSVGGKQEILLSGTTTNIITLINDVADLNKGVDQSYRKLIELDVNITPTHYFIEIEE